VEIDRIRRFSKGWVTLSADFEWNGTSPTYLCWCQKTRVIALSCGIKMLAVWSFVLSQTTCVSDRRTERRTDTIQTFKTALALLHRAVKIDIDPSQDEIDSLLAPLH